MVESEGLSWQKVLSWVLWLTAAAGGLLLIDPVLKLAAAIGYAIREGGPTSQVTDKYRIIAAGQVGMLVYGAIWLVGAILLNSYFGRAKNMGQLLRRFGLVAVIEIAIFGLSIGIQELLLA